jgi:hypothetical protein
MRQTIFYLSLLAILFVSCNNNKRVNTYKNDLGIKPSTLAQMDSANYTAIEWEDTLRNFGTVRIGDTVVARFGFKNSGDKALFVVYAHSSCGCAVVKYPEEAILPGEKGEISATFKNKYQPGFVHQTIIVTTNTIKKRYQTLSFEGQVADGPAGE